MGIRFWGRMGLEGLNCGGGNERMVRVKREGG